CEWTCIPALSILQSARNLSVCWSVHSLERQRSDMTGEISKRIEDIERDGLRAAQAILVHGTATADLAKELLPECGERLVAAPPLFPAHDFQTGIDPGSVKARYQIGPLDPMILFVGDLDERYGPDLLVKALPAILKNRPNARLVVVGDGKIYWPLRVYA